jgi:hypothetical protein
VLAEQAGAGVLAASSLKAALAIDWDDPAASMPFGWCWPRWSWWRCWWPSTPRRRQQRRRRWRRPASSISRTCSSPRDGSASLRHGVAKDRRIGVEDEPRRHGRKSRSTLIDGYKRPVLRDLDSGLVPAVGSTPANVPEATVTGDSAADLAAQDLTLVEVHIDRAYLASTMVRERGQDLAIYCKAWRVANAGRFTRPTSVSTSTPGS